MPYSSESPEWRLLHEVAKLLAPHLSRYQPSTRNWQVSTTDIQNEPLERNLREVLLVRSEKLHFEKESFDLFRQNLDQLYCLLNEAVNPVVTKASGTNRTYPYLSGLLNYLEQIDKVHSDLLDLVSGLNQNLFVFTDDTKTKCLAVTRECNSLVTRALSRAHKTEPNAARQLVFERFSCKANYKLKLLPQKGQLLSACMPILSHDSNSHPILKNLACQSLAERITSGMFKRQTILLELDDGEAIPLDIRPHYGEENKQAWLQLLSSLDVLQERGARLEDSYTEAIRRCLNVHSQLQNVKSEGAQADITIRNKLYHRIVQHLETALENCSPNLGLKRQHSMNLEIESIMEPMNKRTRTTMEKDADLVHVFDMPGELSDAYRELLPRQADLGKDFTIKSKTFPDTTAGSSKGDAQPPKNRCGFKAAIICALPLEFDAIRSLFDSTWQEHHHHYGKLKSDTNHYVNGRIGDLDVVVLLLSSMGKKDQQRFWNKSSRATRNITTLAQLVIGSTHQPTSIRSTLWYYEQCFSSPSLICERCRGVSCNEAGCDEKFLVARCRLQKKMFLEEQGDICEAQKPLIFLGRFGSGDTVLKSSRDRDKLAERLGIAAFEMESAGLWEDSPCIVVKGVCDSADSHKNKEWQDFAAATSASVVKALLERSIITDN
ncbi:nucleoside phosphorylase domain-containing protein [Fusarium sp. MPI-SDFR-AT-0072]|nr:nucleoside phosphorylase domain-containing protein [Fusarium sp. MPI-SDFR-AT-0072]